MNPDHRVVLGLELVILLAHRLVLGLQLLVVSRHRRQILRQRRRLLRVGRELLSMRRADLLVRRFGGLVPGEHGEVLLLERRVDLVLLPRGLLVFRHPLFVLLEVRRLVLRQLRVQRLGRFFVRRIGLYKTIKFNTGNELAIFNSYGKEGDFIGMGLIDKKGNIIAPAIYEQLYHYPEYKIYIVYLKNKRGIFNEEGLQIVAPQYNYISEIAEQDLLRVEKNDMVGYINLKGKIIIPVKYIDVVLAGEGLMAFTLKPQKWGYINYEDKVIIEPMFTFAAPFEDGKCILQKEDGKEYTVYTDGRVIKVVD